MRGWAAVPLLLVAGCGELELELTVTVPDRLKPLLRSAELVVYEPPPGAPFACAELAFARVEEGTLRLAEGQRTRAGELGTLPLPTLDRLRTHVLLVEVRGEAERPLAFACADVPELSNDLQIELEASPGVTLSLPADVTLSRYLGAPLQPVVAVTALDALGAPLAGVPLEWTLAGGSGSDRAGAATTGAEGGTRVSPELPDQPGPVLLELRARWAVHPPRRLSGLQVGEPRQAVLGGFPLAAQAGRFQAGREQVAVLYNRGGAAVVELYDASSFRGAAAELVAVQSHAMPGASLLGRLDYPGDAADRLVGLGLEGQELRFHRLDPGGTLESKTISRPAGAGAPRRVHPAGACRDPGRPLLLVVFDGEIIARYDEQGVLLQAQTRAREDTDFVSAGCVVDDRGEVRRALVRSTSFGWAAVEIETGAEPETVQWFGPAAGIGFAPAIGGAERMIAARVETERLAVTSARLKTATGSTELEVLDSLPLDHVPVALAGQDSDGDGTLDIAALLAPDITTRGARDYALFVGAGRRFGGDHLAGSIPLPDPLCYATLIGGDFDGDGRGDVVVAEVTRLLCGSLEPARAYLYRSGLSAR